MTHDLTGRLFIPLAAATGGVFQTMRLVGAAEPGGAADVFGVSLLACAAGGGLLMTRMRRRDTDRLATQLDDLGEDGLMVPIDWPRDHLSHVVDVVGRTLHRAGELVEDAEAESRRTKVELKIVEAARRHAEAVVGSMEDATIVTDAHDEVLLLNAAARETFGVEGDHAGEEVARLLNCQPIVDGSDGAIVFVGPEVEIGNGVGAGVRKEDDELLANVDEALAALKEDGTVDALIQEYFQAGPFYAD